MKQIMLHNVVSARADIGKQLQRLVTDKIGARLTFHRGEALSGHVFKIGSFEGRIGTAMTDDGSVAIQFAVEDLARVEVHE